MAGDDERYEEHDEAIRRADYFRERTERLAARLVQADVTASTLRQELEQKRRGFSLLARMAPALSAKPGIVDKFEAATVHINPTLNMQRTAVLVPDDDGLYMPALLHGYPRREADAIRGCARSLPAAMLDPDQPVLLNAASERSPFAEVAEWLALPYFISMPVYLHGHVEAVLITGRLREQQPFSPPLGSGDAETVQGITGALSAILGQRRLSEFEHLAKHDPLTGVANLRGGRERLEHALDRSSASGHCVGLLFIDLDGFKPVNDELGHETGDRLLRIIAERMRRAVRDRDTVARIGGDEFLVILPGLGEPARVADVAQKLLASVERPVVIAERRLQVGASIGTACHPRDGATADALMRAADAAMYAAKRQGGNAIRQAG